MSTITKTIAESVAKQLTTKKVTEIDKMKNDLGVLVHSFYLKEIPKPVQDFQKKYPEYIATSGSIYLHGNGFHYKCVNLPKNVRVVTTPNSGTPNFSPNKAQADQIVSLVNKLETATENLAQLRREIQSTLIALRTYKKVHEQFNEAYLLLPNPTTVALTINVDDIRKKL